jgi:hypothetical protein
MGQEVPSPEGFSMKDLFLDVKLEACVNGTTFDFLGRKLFSTEFFREGVGFGITSIDIEVNTSLQPLVTVVFKDLYGLTVFGGQSRAADDSGQSHDYSVLFNWPPPKFLFSFKGYLGKPASWVLNLKRTTTSFNSSDGSYDLKCEFVPNQWGFFADLPFLYLLAAKRLRKDRIGPDATDAQLRGVISVFDLIKIGKQVEIKTSDTTKEFDDLVKQLGSLKSNLARAIVSTNIVSEGEDIDGVVNNQAVKNFTKITIPKLSDLDGNISDKEKLEIKLGIPKELTTLNAYLLLSIKFNGVDNFAGISKDYKTFSDLFNVPGGNEQINTAQANALNTISDNLDKVDDEIKRRVFATSETKLEKITIGEIFAQLARDAAFIMGSILDAGLDGYRGDSTRQNARDIQVENGNLIGESFPMVLKKDGDEVPATKENLTEANVDATSIGVDEHEMQFVKNFISAVSEGIATDLLANNPQSGQDDSILKQRINNMEMSSPNPYKPYYTNIATNILVRGGIAGYMTRSNDPNLPGDYDTTFGGDRDDVQSMQELAERDMQNITDNIITSMSDVDFLLLKRFATFFSRYWTSDFDAVADSVGGGEYVTSSYGGNFVTSPSPGGKNVLTHKIVLSNPNQFLKESSGFNIASFDFDALTAAQLAPYEQQGLQYATFEQIWTELTNQNILLEYSVVGGQLKAPTEIEDAESRREDQDQNKGGTASSGGGANGNSIRNAQNPLAAVSTVDFTATRIVNNGIAYSWPGASSKLNTWWMVIFKGEDHTRALEANTAPTDTEFKNANKDSAAESAGYNEPLGYVSLNTKFGDEDSDDVDEVAGGKYMLKRVGSLMKYRDESKTVYDFNECKNPGPSFFGIPATTSGLVAEVFTQNFLWEKSFKEDANEVIAQESPAGVDYAGKIGYTVCSHLGDDVDSALVFGLFNATTQGRNQRAYIKKCADVLLDKYRDIEDKRNQIIGEVLGKAGEQEGSIYKQMHTLFHQWQTLSYSDKKDKNNCLAGDPDENKGSEGGIGGKVFDVARNLEKRFGSNHRDLKNNEMICFDASEVEISEGLDLTPEERASLVQVSSGPNAGKTCLSISDPNQASSVPDGTFIYDYPMQRIAAPEEPIDVRDSIINLEPLYRPNANTSVLNIIQQICTKNNFLFIPIPGNPGYLNVKEIYSPSMEPANLQIKNFFHVLFTPTPESRTKTRNSDGTALADFTDKQKTYNVNSFVIKYGHPDNQIVSNIQVGTEDNKVTAESIVNLQRLVDNENQNKKVTTDCSMLPVLAGRSYKATVDMLGNSQCYPMQFFFLENSPLFGGLYQVMKVKHAIDPNNMTTSMEGIRMRFSPGSGYGSIKPITLKTFADLGPSEAPLALGAGFDSDDRAAVDAFKNGTATGIVRVTSTANTNDYVNSDFVNGDKGGPVTQAVPILSQDELNTYDTSLGKRETWSEGKITGKEQMYIIDGYPLTAQVLSAYKAIRAAAQADGITLRCGSGYRDPFNAIVVNGKQISSSQYSLRKANVKDKSKVSDDNYLRTAPSSSFKPQTAKPGWSAHNSGLAVDFNCGGRDLNTKLKMDIFQWLVLNAYKFGFVRTVNDRSGRGEEWHWEYRVGKPMFSYCYRNDNLWYGLPDALGIPKDKPTESTTTETGGEKITSKGDYTVYVVDASGNIKQNSEVTRNKNDEFIITVPNKGNSLEAAIFSCGIEQYQNGSPAAGYRKDVADQAPVSLSEKRVMVYAHWQASLGQATAAMNGLLSGLNKPATVKSVLMYSKGGEKAGTFYSSSYRFFGLCDPSPAGNAATKSGNYGANTYLSKNENNWGGEGKSETNYYYNNIPILTKKVKDGGGKSEDTTQTHTKYPGYFMNKYKDKI